MKIFVYPHLHSSVDAVVLTVLDVYIRLYSTPTLCGRATVSTVPDVCRRLYSTPTLISGRTAVSTVPDVCRHLYSTPTLICGRTAVSTHVSTWLISTFYTSYLLLRLRLSVYPSLYASAAHHLPCFQGGKECMATLHSSDRDFTLHHILHLHLANIFEIQAWTFIIYTLSQTLSLSVQISTQSSILFHKHLANICGSSTM